MGLSKASKNKCNHIGKVFNDKFMTIHNSNNFKHVSFCHEIFYEYMCIQRYATVLYLRAFFSKVILKQKEWRSKITVLETYSGVRHFILVDFMMCFKNSFSSCITVFTATYIEQLLYQHMNKREKQKKKKNKMSKKH